MEERKLNFNTPLMSVRRFSALGSLSAENFLMNRRHTLPSHNYDSNMDQVTEPVAVPFLWEQIPGIAKNWTRAEPQPLDQVFEKASEDRVLTELVGSSECSSKGDRDGREGTGLEDDNDDNDVYSDALESLSPADSASFSLNYSVSGLSGSEGPALKPSGTFSVDPRTRDLMMSRFLPAARAMTLEPPQNTARKQLQLAIVPYEQPKEVKQEPVRDIKMLPCKYDPDIIQKYHKQDTGEEDESEDENDKIDDDYRNIRSKACGLIPKLCLLNPILGMKIRSQNSLPVQPQAKKPFKDGCSQAKTTPAVKNADYKNGSDRGTVTPKILGSGKLSSGGSCRFNFSGELQTMRGSLSPFRRSRTGALFPQQSVEYEHKSDPAAPTPRFPGQGAKHFPSGYRPLNYSGELRPMRRSLSPYRHLRADAIPPQHDSGHGKALTPKLWAPDSKPSFAGVSRRFNLSGELQTVRGSLSPYRRSTTDAFSMQKMERSRSPLAGVSTLGSDREVESITRNGSNFPSEARKDQTLQTSYGIERTVYVDSVNVAKNSRSNLDSSDQEVWMDPEAKEMETPVKRTETEDSSEQSTFQEFKSSKNSDSSTCRDLILFHDQKLKGEEREDLNSDSLPPLLKSPSESWLFRTLPSIPSRNIFSPKKQSPKLSSHETKWETIVKSSNLRHDHVRYSEELVTHVTQKSKSKF